ncbi:MAG: 5-methyltetrahydrofolate--homocysteine methyltransferase [Prevotellaceae bacterium]|nr:5-methyltetrahydrofolate--homocysteine methyltransferase [Prevotellaceae bacterium]
MRRDYTISDLTAYINWVYFFHAWSVKSDTDEGEQLRQEAMKMLGKLQPYIKIKTVVEILPAYSDGDDIVVQKMMPCECGSSHPVGEPIHIPMLRQQNIGQDGFCRCMSDYIRPKTSLKQDKIGVFAASVNNDEVTFSNDDYNRMLLQTLADRLAEAGAERLHEEVRKTIWGYAPDESLTTEEMLQGKYQGIRPAVGYPCLPDMSINFILDEIIEFKSIGITLTEHAMMQPHSSVSGFMISLPQAQYFSVGQIDETQARDYARRRNMTLNEIKKYLPCC